MLGVKAIKSLPFLVAFMICFLSFDTEIYSFSIRFLMCCDLVAGVPMPPFSPFLSLSFSCKRAFIFGSFAYLATPVKSLSNVAIV